MIWYLLYPFRGTTEPPKLAPNHPLRKAFLRHGNATARHWLLSIILSVATAALLCYPVLFYDASSAKSLSLPHHFWASARLFEDDATIRADVELRQVWVHGDYMKAIDKGVLREALNIQDALIGAAFTQHVANDGASQPFMDAPIPAVADQIYHDACKKQTALNVSWGFHSPLMYWDCSHDSLESDSSLLDTINRQTKRQSFLKLTLRPTSVFAGKVFSQHKLQAADALVITLISRADSRAGVEWDLRSMELARTAADRGWRFYPETGAPQRSQLFQFRIQPMSLRDDFFLAAAYIMMAVYVVVSLRKLRAVKSRFGLVVTVIAQIAISIFASFTICGLLKINLARIPREAYPFVVLVIGLENMFRLINAILANPAEKPTLSRVSHALADVGHLSLAAAGQNLLVLWLLSRLVSPGVAAFCAFAAVAIVFDFVFHLTFFVAVLSVDVRRLELQDSLDRVKDVPRKSKSPSGDRRSWGNALLQGDLPISTRLAGSAVTIIFILSLNWHFFDQEKEGWKWFNPFSKKMNRHESTLNQASMPAINQARTPWAWLQIQAQDNAKEVIEFVQPNLTHSFVARIYNPLLVVTDNADRHGPPSQNIPFISVIRDLMDRHIFPFALIVVFIIAIITLLMNYLLWTGLPDDEEDLVDEIEPEISVKNLLRVHTLDVVKLQGCSSGHMVSVSLDKTTCIWTLDPRTNVYSHSVLRTDAMTPQLWPIAACAVGECGAWLALCAGDGKIALWTYNDRRFVRFVEVDLRGHPAPALFQFMTKGTDQDGGFALVVLMPDGFMTEIDMDESQPIRTHNISSSLVSRALLIFSKQIQPRLVTIHRSGEMRQTVRQEGIWTSTTVDTYSMPTSVGELTKSKPSFFLARNLSAFALAHKNTVHLLDWITLEPIHMFRCRTIKSNSFRLLSSHPRPCSSCGGPAVRFLSLVYTDLDTNACVMQSFMVSEDDEESEYICLHSGSSSDGTACPSIENATNIEHIVEKPGVWEATKGDAIIGVRRVPIYPSSPVHHGQDVPEAASSSKWPSSTGLRQRLRRTASSLRLSPTTSREQDNDDPDVLTDDWEAWSLSSSGEFHSTSLLMLSSPTPRTPSSPLSIRSSSRVPPSPQWFGDGDQLYVTKPGPIAPLGSRSVAVVLGNSVKIVSAGSERFERSNETENSVWEGSLRLGGRRKGRKGIPTY